ncbi:hypothetical protein IWQ62_000208 [Dispira parvispora]|uniref:Ribosomal RNA-processing protein 14/surfeit locus protein 6 C-terminal domain-containing protein n=1 Tax=Dispira parvispora TaxID=1520584 RepID=A0A9W8E9W4_9FUNG|nr:hypothetical protein IWQ62_000208 [Dispira parvispora]
MAVSTDSVLEGLPESMQQHEQVFDSILQLIPAKYYFPHIHEKEVQARFMKHVHKNATKHNNKLESKLKRQAKLDPHNTKTIQEIQQEQQLLDQWNDDGSLDSDNDDDLDDNSSRTSGSLKALPQSNNIEELRAKLHARISASRAQRQAREKNPEQKSPRRTKNDTKANRLKRKQAEKEKRTKDKTQAGFIPNLGRSVLDTMNGTESDSPAKSKINGVTNGRGRSMNGVSKDTGDDTENLQFGTVDLSNEAEHQQLKARDFSAKRKRGTSAVQYLRMAEKKQQELDLLAKQDKDTFQQMKKDITWNRALAMTKGEKLNDDAKLLKKKIKRHQTQKRKSEREWSERKEQTASQIQKRQRVREENIRARIDDKKNKGKGKKKVNNKKNQRPGFEGSSKFPLKKK